MRFTQTWSPCTVEAVRDVTPAIREIVLRPTAGGVAPYPIGSHINVGTLIGGQPDVRSYSLVGDHDPKAYRIAVRLAPDSRGGSQYMWSLQPGARVEISNPSSLFEIDWTRKNFCLLAGGIGITPIIGIASALLRRGADVELHYAVKSRSDAAYLEDLAALLKDRLFIYASDERQRLDIDATFASQATDAMAIMCGPMRMLEAARKSWNASGRSPVDLRYETFGSSGLLPTEAFRVRVKNSDIEIEVPQGKSMLKALCDAGHEIMSDCQRGECGVCAIDVVSIEGQIDHRDVFFSDHQKQTNGKICPCVSRAMGTITVDTLYQADAV
jgi:vanillate O-demethylase ferredoxin subunit